MLLRTAQRHPEAGHHLVEDQQRAVFSAQLAQPGQETLHRQHDSHVARDGLHDDPGDLAAMRLEQRSHCGQIVVGRHQGILDRAAGTPGLSGSPNVATPLPAWTSSMSAWP